MDTVKISILGDVCPTTDYRPYWDNGTVFNAVTEKIGNSDLSIVNLECPATDTEKKITKCGPCLKAKSNDVSLIKNSGFNLISLANNHIKDFCAQGVLDTIVKCEKENVDYVGAGATINEAKKPKIHNIKGRRIGVISFAEKEFNLATETEAGANFFDVYESPEQIKAIKEECDFLVVLYHGGIEHYIYPSETLQKKCRLMVRFGADVVLCQHSHCIGTFENYKGGYILYGQGNGVYGYRENSKSWNEGILLSIELSENVKITPIFLNATPNGIVVLDEQKSDNRLKEFLEKSQNVYDEKFLKEQWIKFCEKNGDLNRPLFYGKSRVYIKLNRILKNKPFKLNFSKKKEMVTMNLIRCDAWREVITTLLEKDVYDK